MEIRENPGVTQLAIARPNPFDPRKHKTKNLNRQNIKENPSMLIGSRNDEMQSSSWSGSGHRGFSESSEDLARRENIRRALSQLDDSSMDDSRENPKVRRRGASKTRAFSAGGSRGRKALSTVSEAGVLDTNDIKKVAEQVRKLRKEYVVSQSPSVKKRLDRAVAKLEQLSEYVNKDLRKLEEAATLLAANPAKKGGKMRKTTRKTASTRKPAAKKRASVSAFKGLLSELKAKKSTKRKTSKARKNPLDSALGLGFDQESEIFENPKRKSRKTSAKKSTARKSTARKSTARKSTARKSTARKNPLGVTRAIESSTLGMTVSNPKKKSRKTTVKKSTARKSTLARRKSSARKNAAPLDGLMGLMNPKRKSRKTTAKKSTARKSTLARRKSSARKNAAPLDGLMGLMNPKRKSRKTTAKKSTARKSTARKSTARKSSLSRRKSTSAVKVTKRTTRARLNPLSRSVSEALRHFGHDFLTIHRAGKNTKLKANKSSAEYKSAKSKGLSGRFAALKGKKNTPYSLNIRSVHAISQGTPSVAEIQKALNAWAGAFDGGHLKSAKANPKKRRSSAAALKRRKATVKSLKTTAKKRKSSLKRRKSTARKNPLGLTRSSEIITNPKRKSAAKIVAHKKRRKASVKSAARKNAARKTTKRRSSAKVSSRKVHSKKRSSARVTARRRSVAKKHHRKSSKKGFRPMGMALMHRHNPAGVNFIGNYTRQNPEGEVGMGTKLGYGALGFTTSWIAGNAIAGIVDNLAFKAEDFQSSGKIATDVATHAALGIGSYLLYQNSSKNEEMNSLFVGVASGLIGSAIARNVSGISSFIGKIPGIGAAMRFIGGDNSYVAKEESKSLSGFGRFLSENPLETMSGYIGSDALDGYDFETSSYMVDRYAGMGKYVPMDVDSKTDVEFVDDYGLGDTFEDANLYNSGYDSEDYDFDEGGLGKYVRDAGNPEDRTSTDATRIAQAQVSLTNNQILTEGLGSTMRHHHRNPMGAILVGGQGAEELVQQTAVSGFHGVNPMLGAYGVNPMLGAYGVNPMLGAYGNAAPVQAAEIMSNQAAASIAPTRTTATGVDIKSLVSELKDIDSLDNEELRQEGIPDVASLDVAVVRATPFFARQIAESNLGYMLAPSSVVKGTYLVGLYVGPESLLANTGMGARDVSVPMGVRNARPAGIFTSTVFSSIIPSADGGPIWSGGEFGDM